jgi:hypothetical protein
METTTSEPKYGSMLWISLAWRTRSEEDLGFHVEETLTEGFICVMYLRIIMYSFKVAWLFNVINDEIALHGRLILVSVD